MRSFTCTKGGSDRFFNIELRGKAFTMSWGRVGGKALTKTQEFDGEAAARKAHDKLIRQVLAKGYVETPAGGARGRGMREALEEALAADPDDVATAMAYADYLQEQGDPRGEFVSVQLALEDEKRPATERKQLRRREEELLQAHEREWLGEPLAHYLLDHIEAEPRSEHRWQRGLLAHLRVQSLTRAFAQALAAAPAARFLRTLHVEGEARYWDLEEVPPPPPRVPTPQGVREHWELLELIGAPCLATLRVFQMGDVDGEPPADGWGDCHTYAAGLEHVLAGMTRIEELHLLCKEYDIDHLFALPNLDRLRVLRVYHFGVRGNAGERARYEYPLDVLAANPALGNLTHVLFHPHQEEYHPAHYGRGRRPSFLPLGQVRALVRSPHLKKLTHLQLRLSNMGDEGCEVLVASGILRRLTWLDLRHGCVTDDGARLLAACPDVAHLEHLDLSRNALTIEGIRALQAAGVRLRAVSPLTDQEQEEESYLFEGDGE
jgi:uncharacterized protein (TIGR02996 family)